MEGIETSDKKANAKGAWPHLTAVIVMLIASFAFVRHLVPWAFGLKEFSEEELYAMAESAVKCVGAIKVEDAAAEVLRNAGTSCHWHFPDKGSALYMFNKKLPNAEYYWVVEGDAQDSTAYLLLRFGTHARYRFLVFAREKDSPVLSKCIKKLSDKIGFADNSIRDRKRHAGNCAQENWVENSVGAAEG